MSKAIIPKFSYGELDAEKEFKEASEQLAERAEAVRNGPLFKMALGLVFGNGPGKFFPEEILEANFCASLELAGIPYQRQVRCEAGIADVVTTGCVFEIKVKPSRSQFFQAIGQVLLYQEALSIDKAAVLIDADTYVQDLIPVARRAGVEVLVWKS